MKKYILGTLFTFCLLLSPVFTPPAEAAGLTPVQVSAIVSLLQSLGVDQSVINNVQAALGGGALSTGGATLTVNGQSQVANADPLVSRTWAWSGTPGATYTASGNLTGCDTASQNGPQSNWTPWIGGTGTATSGSSSIIPGAVKYGCVIVGTYNVTKNGQTNTSTATITFKHANGTANTATVNTSGLQITSGIPAGNMPAIVSSSGLQITSDNLPAGDIPNLLLVLEQGKAFSDEVSYTTTLAYTGGTGTPVWSLVEEDGKLPSGVYLNKDTGVIFGYLGQMSNFTDTGIYYFTVKLAVGSDVVTKRLSITMNRPSRVASANQVRVLTTTLPPAVVGKPYYATITISPEVGVSNNTWGAAGQSYEVYGSTFHQKIPGFPEGLMIDARTGVISGIPIRVGTTSFIVTVGNKQSQSSGSSDSMYYTIQVASSPDVTRLVSLKTVLKGNDIGWVNNGIESDIYRVVTTANFSDGSLVGQKIIYRQLGEIRNRTRNFQGPYCLQKVSPWSDEGPVPGITVREDLGSKSFPATKVHTYGIEYQIDPAGTYEFVAVATAADGSTFKAAPPFFMNNHPDWSQGDLSQAAMLALPPDQRHVPSTCTYNGQNYVGVIANSSAVAVQTFQEEVQTGWGVAFPNIMDAVAAAAAGMGLTPTNPTTPPAQSVVTPTLTSLSPSSGKAGTTVTITASGLLGTNSIYLNGSPVDTLNSSGGSTPTWISFVIPSNLPSCPSYARSLCTPGPAVTTGSYTVSVQNTNGTSNSLSLGVN